MGGRIWGWLPGCPARLPDWLAAPEKLSCAPLQRWPAAPSSIPSAARSPACPPAFLPAACPSCLPACLSYRDLSTGDAIRIYSGHHKATTTCALNDSAIEGRDDG
jgi:hypothetical protein